MTARKPHPSVTTPESDRETLKKVSARGEVCSDAKSFFAEGSGIPWNYYFIAMLKYMDPSKHSPPPPPTPKKKLIFHSYTEIYGLLKPFLVLLGV